MSTKQFFLIISFFIIVLIGIIYFTKTSKSIKENDEINLEIFNGYAKKPVAMKFAYFKIDAVKHIKILPQMGRVLLHIRSTDSSAIEIHKTFLSDVNFEIKNDSLIIHSLKPKKEDTKKIINLFLPTFESLESNICKVIINGFTLNNCKIVSNNDNVRFYKNHIQQLNINCSNNSAIQIDPVNVINNATIYLDKKSLLNSSAIIENKITIHSDSPEQIIIKQIEPYKFQWIKL